MREWVAQITPAGHLPGQTRREFDDLVRSLSGKRVRIRVALYQKRRSNSQNAFYWGVVIPLVTRMFRDAGNYVDDDDTHEYLKLRVGRLAQAVVLPDGNVERGLGSTTKLTTTEFELYLERIRAWSAPFGLVIPLPNEELRPETDAGESSDH